MHKLFVGAACVLCLIGAAQAMPVTVDFEAYAAGTVIDDEYASLGLTISATGGSNQAMVFDTNNPTGGDTDLAGPFDTPTSGGTDNFSPGNVLIISEDGDSSDPDDNARGGTITFAFDHLVEFIDINIFDIDLGETLDLTFAGGSLEDSAMITGDLVGNGNYLSFATTFLAIRGQTIEEFLGFPLTFTTLTLSFSGSGAVDDLKFAPVSEVPLPAAAPLLLMGLGGLSLASRRRRKA